MKKIFLTFVFCAFLTHFCFAGIAVLGSLTKEVEVRPGGSSEGVILLKNTSSRPEEAKVYQTDYLFYSNGKNIYGEPGTVPRSNSGWVTLSNNRVIVPPGETASVYYAIQIPNNPDLKGSYWSLIMVEGAGEPPKSIKEIPGKAQFGIRTNLRYAIQVITNIGKTGESKIKFLDKKIVTQDGGKIFQLDVENTGERTLSPFAAIELYNKDGAPAGRYSAEPLRIYPGCSVRYSIDLSAVAKGKYKSLLIIDNKDDNVFGAQYDINIE